MKNLTKFFGLAVIAMPMVSSCSQKVEPVPTKSGLDPQKFVAEINGKKTGLYTLTNANGMEVCLTNLGGRIVSIIIPRAKHRPDCYFKQGEEQVMVSPGTLDMGGLIITPRKEDFEKMDGELAKSIIRECAMSQDEELEMIVNFKRGG